MDVKDGHLRLGQFCLEPGGSQTIASADPLKAGITDYVADRVHADGAPYFVRIFGDPAIEHEVPATASQQAGLLREPSLGHQMLMQGEVERPTLRDAIGFAHVQTGDGDPRLQKPFKRQFLRPTRQPAQGRCIQDPRNGFSPWIFRQNEECGAPFHGEHLALYGKALLDSSQLEGGEKMECRGNK